MKTPDSLEALLPEQVRPLHKDSNSVMVRGKMDILQTESTVFISVSEQLKNQSLICLYIEYLRCPKFIKNRPSTRIQRALSIKNFISFVESSEFNLHNELPKNIFHLYFAHLKKISDKTSFYGEMLHLRTPLKQYQKNDINISISGKGSIADYLSNIPKVPPPENNPQKSMAMIFEKDCPYNDKQLLISLKLLCCVLLEELDKVRVELKNNIYISETLTKLCKSGAINSGHAISPNLQSRYHKMKGISRGDYDLVRKLSLEIIEEARNSNNLIVRELLIEGGIGEHFPDGVGDIEDLQSFIDTMLERNESGKMYEIFNSFLVKNNEVEFTALKFLSPRFLGGITDLEIFLVQCLLSSDSVQRSGLLSHKISDFSVHIESIQSQYKKPRRKKGSATPIYKRNTLIYQAYSRYAQSLKEMQSWIPEKDRELSLPYSTKPTIAGSIGYGLPKLQILELICKPKSILRKRILEISNEEVEPALWLLERIVDRNKLAYKLRNTSNKITSVSLGSSAISMSRKRVDDNFDVFEKENSEESADSYIDDKVNAELNAHSVQTNKNVYNLRSNSKEKIKSTRRFGEQIGELMEQDAEKAISYINSTQLIDRSQLKKILNIEDLADDFQEMIESVETDNIEIWGGITISDKTYVIANKTTAMLLYGFSRHIEDELPRLFNESIEKAREAQVQLAYINEIFHQYPEALQQTGKSMSEEYDIEYPSLL